MVDWAAAEGWNPGLGDADTFWATDADGFVGVHRDGALVASGSIVSYAGEFGFLGFFIVRPELRGQGLGRQLWCCAARRAARAAAPGRGDRDRRGLRHAGLLRIHRLSLLAPQSADVRGWRGRLRPTPRCGPCPSLRLPTSRRSTGCTSASTARSSCARGSIRPAGSASGSSRTASCAGSAWRGRAARASRSARSSPRTPPRRAAVRRARTGHRRRAGVPRRARDQRGGARARVAARDAGGLRLRAHVPRRRAAAAVGADLRRHDVRARLMALSAGGRVAVIGAGPSGLAVAKDALEAGLSTRRSSRPPTTSAASGTRAPPTAGSGLACRRTRAGR